MSAESIAVQEVGAPGKAAAVQLPRQRSGSSAPKLEDWDRWLQIFRSVFRLRVELVCHSLLDEADDLLADSLADLAARLATGQSARWRWELEGLDMEGRAWWHSPGQPNQTGCRFCRRLAAGLTPEMLATLPVPAIPMWVRPAA